MKNKKLIALIVALIAVLGVSAFLYPKLTEQFELSTSPAQEQLSKTPEASAADAQPVDDEESPQIVPDFTVLDIEGNTVSLSDYFGKPVILNFWATWCDPCKSELPAFESIYAQYGEEINFLKVNLTDGVRDTVDGTKNFAEENGYTFPIYFDTKRSAAYAYGVRSIPMTVFIAADGTLIDYWVGALSEDTLAGYIDMLIR